MVEVTMRFENGRFAGSSNSTLLFVVIRFDERSSIISGEIYDGTHAPSNLRNDPVAKAMFEFVANFLPVNPIASRTKNAAEVSSDGEGITITDSRYVLSFKKGQDPDVLTFKFVDNFQVEFSGQVARTNQFRRIYIDSNQEPGARIISSAQHNDKTVTIESCLAEAGIQLTTSPTSLLTDELVWTKAELDAFLRTKTSGATDQWKFHLLVASRYVDSDVNGYMFDDDRFGAAVFTNSIADDVRGSDGAIRNNKIQKNLIRVFVHELGHCLNLKHSFDQSNGSSLPTFMNYPYKYPGGESEFWKDFNYVFTNSELIHLVHESNRNLIAGGKKYRLSPDNSADFSASRITRNRKLELTIRVRPKRETIPIFEFGEPVFVEFKLRQRSKNGRVTLKDRLSPEDHGLRISITNPKGESKWYRSIGKALSENYRYRLTPNKPTLHEMVYLGYDEDGFNFLEPGRYRIDASYEHLHEEIRAEPLFIWVRFPSRELENLVVPTFDDECGRFFAIGGGPHLRKAHKLFRELARRNPKLTLCHLYQSIDAIQKSQGFRTLARGNKLKFHDPKILDGQISHLIGVDGDCHPCHDRANVPNILYADLCSILWHFHMDQSEEPKARTLKRTFVNEMKQNQRARKHVLSRTNSKFKSV
jgi:hypothetical protein